MSAAADESTRFVLLVRGIGASARELGLTVPHFQSPPRSAHLDRSIQRRSPRDCVVAVRLRGRPFADVVADVIDGIVICNNLTGDERATEVRRALHRAVENLDLVGERPNASARSSSPVAHQPDEGNAKVHAASGLGRAPGGSDAF